MKKLLLIPAAVLAFACNDGNRENGGSEANSESNVEKHSGENISPQLDNQGEDRFSVDTMSDTNEVRQEKQDELR